MSFAGTCLTKTQWLQALKTGAAQATAAAASARPTSPVTEVDQLVEHLVDLSLAGQKEYAWWAAHLYAEILGRAGADIPQRLQAAMQSIADQQLNQQENP